MGKKKLDDDNRSTSASSLRALDALQGLGETLLELVYTEGTQTQWDEWLRVPIELASSTGCSDLCSRLLDLTKKTRGQNPRPIANGHASPRAAAGSQTDEDDEDAAAVARAGAGGIWSSPSAEDGHVGNDGHNLGTGKGVQQKQQQQRQQQHKRQQRDDHVDVFPSESNPNPNSPDTKDASGNAPLHLAIARRDAQSVSILLSRGADTEMTDSNGYSPLLLAVGRRHLPIAVALLKAGADPALLDGPNGTCSLMEAASRAHHAEMLQLLVAHGASVDAPDADGNTAMHHAAMLGDTRAIDILVGVGADVAVKNPLDGSSPLHWAASKGKCEALLALLRHGAHVDANDDHGRTPLHDACSVDDVHEREAAELLLIWGADDTATDNNGFTASDYFRQIAGKRYQQQPPMLMDSGPAAKAWCRHGLSVVLCKARLGKLAVKAMLDRLVTIEEEELFERSWSANEEFLRSYVLDKKLEHRVFTEVFQANARGTQQGFQPYRVKRTTRWGLPKEDEDRLLEEVRILRMLENSNVVGVHEFFDQSPDYFYVVLKRMEGGVVLDRIVTKPHYSEEYVRDLSRVLITSVKDCHDLGIVHRDLKPENLFLRSQGDDTDIKLDGFDFACSVLDGKVSERYGSPEYAAPEVLRALPNGTAADMWSVGVIMYILLGGYHPFHDERHPRLLRRIRSGSFKFHEEYWQDTSEAAKDFILNLLVVDAGERMTAAIALNHPWMLAAKQELAERDLGKNLQQLRIFHATRKLRAAIKSVMSSRRDLDTMETQLMSS